MGVPVILVWNIGKSSENVITCIGHPIFAPIAKPLDLIDDKTACSIINPTTDGLLMKSGNELQKSVSEIHSFCTQLRSHGVASYAACMVSYTRTSCC